MAGYGRTAALAFELRLQSHCTASSRPRKAVTWSMAGFHRKAPFPVWYLALLPRLCSYVWFSHRQAAWVATRASGSLRAVHV